MEDITTSNNIQTLSADLQKECFCTDDGWSHIFTFLGKGHYLLLALVCKRFAKLYAKLYPKITYGDISGYSLSLAKFFFSEWRQNLPFHTEEMWFYRANERKGFALSYIERCAAKYGTIDILEWIYELEGEKRLEQYRLDTRSHRKPDGTLRRRCCARKPPKKGLTSIPSILNRQSLYQTGEAAVEANQVQVLKFLLEKYRLIEKEKKFFCKFIKNAAGKGHLQCIKFLCENECNAEDIERYSHFERLYDCQSAARHGQLECLKHLKEQGWPVDGTVMLEAAEAGHLHCIQYLRSVECPWEGEDGFNVSENDITEACAGSSLECLIYCHDNGCNIDFNLACMAAVKNGKIDCIEYLRSKGVLWSNNFTEGAAEHDQLDCLQYLRNNGCPWNELACLKAVHGDANRCLQYLHENGCQWGPDVLILEALHYGRFYCLKYLLRVGTALPNEYESILIEGDAIEGDRLHLPDTFRSRIHKTHKDCLGYCLQYLKETGQHDSTRDLMLKAISHGLAQTLQHLSSEEIKNDTTIAGYAANHGQLECLTYLHENGFRWDENSYAGYLMEDESDLIISHIRCLRYMKEHELETNQNALLHTIRAGYVQFIDFLIKDEWKSNDTFCMEAIRNGHLHCFELLITRGFTFDPKLCAIEAASLGNIACLEFMHMHGYVLPKEALDAAESNGRIDCVEYFKKHFQCECKGETSRKRSANDANLNNL